MYNKLLPQDLTIADFFSFRRLKDELAVVSLDQNILQSEWEGVTRSITFKEFATVFRQWSECFQKCIEILGGYVRKC